MANIIDILDTNRVRDNNAATQANFEELNTKKVESDEELLDPANRANFVKVNGMVFIPKADYDSILSYDANILYLTDAGLYLGNILIADIGSTPCP